MRPIWAEVNLDRARENALEIRNFVGKDVRIMAIVKANGYGHGAVRLSLEVEDVVDMFGAAILQEALELKHAGIRKPILVLGFTAFEDYGQLIGNGIIQTVFNYHQADILDKVAASLGKKARIHVKVDTGMNRLGFQDREESLEVIQAIDALPHISLEGIYSHMANGGMEDLSYSRLQLERFQRFAAKSEALLGRPLIKHLANSATLVEFPEAHFDMVRPGLMLYGSFSTSVDNIKSLKLRKILTLKGIISQVKTVEAGEPVSYTGSFVTSRKTRLGVLPLGYGDGFSRALSNQGKVVVRGQKVPIVGNICMDQLMLDLTDVPEVEIGQEVIIYGEENPVEEFAELLGTINYEIYCNISERIPRIYVRD